MAERLDPRPLIAGVMAGLRNRRASGEEPPDTKTRWILFGTPVLVALAISILQIEMSATDQILAACALLAGALLTAFAQIASWRERILARHRKVDAVDVRALNEAAAHVLVNLMVAVVTSVCVLVLANLDLPSCELSTHIAAVALSAIAAGLFAYIAISLLIVANLLWDAYGNEQREAAREGLQELDEDDDV